MPKEKEAELKLKNGKWELKHDGKKGDHNGPPTDPAAYPVIKLNKDEGLHLITFEIETPDITFSKDAIWVNEGSKPQPGGSHTHDQIAWRVDPEGKKLYVVDWNDNSAKPPHTPIDLHYQLNFSDGTSLDPIINNGGTTKPFVEPPGVAQTVPRPTKSTEVAGSKESQGFAGQIAGLDVAAMVLGLVVGLIVGFLIFRR
jgi:hypothetical protein